MLLVVLLCCSSFAPVTRVSTESSMVETLVASATGTREQLLALCDDEPATWRFRRLAWDASLPGGPVTSLRDGVEHWIHRPDGLVRVEARTRLESKDGFQPRVERYSSFYSFATGECVFRSRRLGDQSDKVYLRYWSQLPPIVAWSRGWIGLVGSLPSTASWHSTRSAGVIELVGTTSEERYKMTFEDLGQRPRLVDFERRSNAGRRARIQWRFDTEHSGVALIAFESVNAEGLREEAAVWTRMETSQTLGVGAHHVGPDAHVIDLRVTADNVLSREMDRKLDWADLLVASLDEPEPEPPPSSADPHSERLSVHETQAPGYGSAVNWALALVAAITVAVGVRLSRRLRGPLS